MSAELVRLRWRGVWLPVVGVGSLLLLLEGFLEFFPESGWRSHVFVVHLLLMLVIAAGAYLFSGSIFGMLQQKEEEVSRQNQALLALDKRFRALIENSSDGIILIGADSEILYVSPSSTRILGYSAEEAAHLDGFQFVHPDDRESAKIRFAGVFQKPGGVASTSLRVRHKDGSWRWIGAVASNLLAEPSVQAVVINYRDITERKQAEERVQSLARFPSENPSPILRVDAEGVILYANPASERLLREGGCVVGGPALTSWGHAARESLASRMPEAVEIQCGERTYSIALAPVPESGYVNLYGQDITERVQAEEALRKANARLSAVLESITDSYFVLDREWRILEVNPAAAQKLFGRPAGELRGRVLWEEFPQATDTESYRQYHLAVAEGRPVHFEAPLAIAEGRWFEAHAYPRNGRLEVYLREITERKHAEEEQRRAHDSLELRVQERTGELARASEDLATETRERTRAEGELHSLFHGVPVGLYRTTPAGQYLAANLAMAQMLGYPDQAALMEQANAADFYVDLADRQRLQAIVQRDGVVRDFEIRLRRRGGALIWVRLSVRGIQGSDGRVLQYEGVVEDITERKRAGQALRENEARLAGIVGSAMEAIITADADQRVILFNAAAEQVFRCPAAEALGQPLERFIPLRFLDRHREGFRAFGRAPLASHRIGTQGFITARRADGEEFAGEAAISQVEVNGEKLFTIVLRDITERKQAEERLRESREMLRALAARLESIREDERTRIAREIHDELGQVLTSLKIDMLHLAANLPQGDGPRQQKVESMVGLLDGTLDLVRKIATDLRPGALDDLGLVPAIEWQTADFQTRTGIPCQFTSDPEDFAVESERATALFRILQETLTNVARHANATGVTVRLREERGTVTLVVADSGRGIAPDEVAGARSLGLLGMRERAHLLGGEVTIAGVPGQGTTVTVKIPLAGPAANTPARQEEHSSARDRGGPEDDSHHHRG